MSGVVEQGSGPTGVRRWLAGEGNRSLALAVGTGMVLRLVWIATATRPTSRRFTDAANFIRIAEDLADGTTPQFGGRPSAFFPPGYPMLLVPFEWLRELVGGFELYNAAALLNALFATATVALAAVLADEWIGRTARNPTAWLVALAPAQIYFTSTFVSESVYTAVSLGALVVLTRAIRSKGSTGVLVGAGALVGFAVLVRSPGMMLLVVPALVTFGLTRRWAGSLRVSAWVVLGALMVLAPWAVRNGVEVGVWTPTSTNNATVICIGHRDGADGLNSEDPALYRDCYRQSPYDNADLYADLPAGTVSELPDSFVPGTPDEARWYQRNTRDAIRWALTHPLQEVRLVWWKTFETMGDESTAFYGSQHFDDKEWPSPFASEVFTSLANFWHWGVMALAASGLALVRACRRATPIWGFAVLQLAMIWGGVAQVHYKLPIMPLVAILAGAAIAAARSGGGVSGSSETAALLDTPEPSPEHSDAVGP